MTTCGDFPSATMPIALKWGGFGRRAIHAGRHFEDAVRRRKTCRTVPVVVLEGPFVRKPPHLSSKMGTLNGMKMTL